MTDDNDLSVESSENAEPMLSVLVVDCDSTCLRIVSEMLHTLGYAVTTAKRAHDALSILQEREDELDLILTEIQLPDMDEYELLEKMGEVSCLPIVILSSDNDENVMLGGLFKGAAFYFVKPITMNNVKNLWQFSCMKNNNNMTTAIEGMSSFQSEPPEDYASSEALECQSFSNTGEQSAQKGKTKNIEDVDKNDEQHSISNDFTLSKKPKAVWTNELHNKFLRDVTIFSIDGAHPKGILQYMNASGLKKKHVRSHLQKYHLSLKREQDAIQETMIRDYYPSSSVSFLQPQLLMAACQHEFTSHFLPYATCISCSHVGFRSISDGEFATFGQTGNDYIEEVLSQRSTLSNLGNAGSEWAATHGPTFFGSYRQQQQFQFLLPELSSLTQPPRQVQELHVFENEREEIDQSSDMEKGSI